MTEASCTLISSRGILKSCQHRHMAPSSSAKCVGYDIPEMGVFSFLKARAPSIYICSYAVDDFVTNHLRFRKKPFILVTGDSDSTIPTDCPQSAEILLAHPLLVAWFSQNCVGAHPKLHKIPIGLDYHTMAHEDTPWGKQISPIDQEELIKRLNVLPVWKRTLKCYGNFHFSMQHRYAQIDRVDAIASIPPESIDYEESQIERAATWEKMARYAFIPSPHGNGLDCHRTWEALALGCIPIVRTSKLDSLYEGLPVWIVREWNEVTPDAMQRTVDTFSKVIFDLRRLELSFWMNKIIHLQNND